ncbi:hypothetical protein SHIRM173S_00408 [Streptomyces hirsutus]
MGVDQAGQQDVVAEVRQRAVPGTGASYGRTAVIVPPVTATDAARVPSGVMTRVERSTSPASDTRTPSPDFNVLLKESHSHPDAVKGHPARTGTDGRPLDYSIKRN